MFDIFRYHRNKTMGWSVLQNMTPQTLMNKIASDGGMDALVFNKDASVR
ncbi:hypothetical protein PJE062_2547 [Pseudovibrio sp. JE062]|nr:hypothetical protein PJE062_2547 [Pseudovibrio sp. JE062]